MTREEAIDRLNRIAEKAVHTPGETPFAMSIDDGIAVHMAIEALQQPNQFADGDKKDDHLREATKKVDVISRQAAIDAHYEYCNKHPDAGFPVWSLKILEDLPSAQPEKRTDKRMETHSCDCISRQAAIAAANRADYRGLTVEDVKKVTDEVVKELKQLPPTQTGQPDIIACGDCKYWICHDRRCGYWNHGVNPLDWCCHAERRTDG